MKNNYFIGLGGSGGKVITQLYNRLLEERGTSFGDDVACIAIDTDQGELQALSELGVQKICISGRGSIGQYYNVSGEDVGEWFPNTQDETVYFGDKLFNGASQSRIKSRLLFSTLLKDKRNEFFKILEDAQTATATGDSFIQQDPVVLIASSLAGGTGSGIFIQTALYVKEFFRQHGIQQVQIYGLFALPDLYVAKVDRSLHRNLYSNAYAAIRELNAFNLICGPDETAAYGGKIELDIEISTDSEGKLFEKDDKGRYTHKPFDNMYFIDKVNCMSTIRGGLDEYYKAMADIAYTHLYTPIKTAIQSTESNETKNHIVAPTAIYGSAGATTAKYPFDDILEYFATRAIWESIENPEADEKDAGTVWRYLDNKWNNYCSTKDASAKARGLAQYIPEQNEREARYIDDFEAAINTGSISKNKFSFLAPMVTRKYGEIDVNAVDAYFKAVKASATLAIEKDAKIQNEKANLRLDDILREKANVTKKIDGYSSSSETDDEGNNKRAKQIFLKIREIDDGLENFCKKCITHISDMSIDFSNKIFCNDLSLEDAYDKEEIGIINGLLYNNQTGEWAHPVAARYLLYSLRKNMEQQIDNILTSINDTVANDEDDFYNFMVSSIVNVQKKALRPNSETNLSNFNILQKTIDKAFVGKKRAKKGVDQYFRKLTENVGKANISFVDALLLFSYSKVIGKIEALIKEYENFFDHIGEFAARAEQQTARCANVHDKSYGVVYVCAKAATKDLMYKQIGKYINTQSGEVASEISRSLFTTMRNKAVVNASVKGKKKVNLQQDINTINSILEMMVSVVRESFAYNPQIQALHKNVFEAMLYEYELLNPDHAEDIKNMSSDKAAETRIVEHITKVLNNIAIVAAPAIIYDDVDMYSGLFKKDDGNGGIQERDRVSLNYRFISHNANVAESINAVCGGNVKADDFYDKCSGSMPKDTEKMNIRLSYVEGDSVDDDTMVFYSAVNCLQPYQIGKFNELEDGIYFTNYADIIEEMEREGKVSLTPHLDKRWHKHGVMPYINVSKEIDRRNELAKAFIFALAYKKIGYQKEGVISRFVFQDLNMKPKREPEIIVYKGRSIPYNRMNRVLRWFENQDALISLYAAKLDMAIDEEIEMLSRNDDTVATYNTAITNQSNLLHRIRENIISPIAIGGSKTGKDKKTTEKEDNMGILKLAWEIHDTEENDFDKDYGELIVDALCDIIRRYAKAPYNAEHIEKKIEGSESYGNYVHIRNHMATKFMEAFFNSVYDGKKKKRVKKDEEANKGGAFGRGYKELEDNFETEKAPVSSLDLSEFDCQDKSVNWAKTELIRYIEQ